MAKISVMTLDKAPPADAAPGCVGPAPTRACFAGPAHPLHLHVHAIAPGETLHIAESAVDRLAYVWCGSVDAAGRWLDAGSSLIVEHGRAFDITGGGAPSQVLTFAAAHPPSEPRPGGHVHLLPAGQVARMAAQAAASGVSGGMHFDSACPTCELWLHENHFPGMDAPTAEDQARGVHSHSEDEIIFVTDGAIRLGGRLYGPGTALAIAADTLYGFTAGPEGLSFVNFRAGTPGDIRFASGGTMSETGYWREHAGRPEYIEV
jgi:hypothetical protein